MAALTADRNTPRLGDDIHPYDHPVKGSTLIYAGALVCLNASKLLVPGAAATTLKAVGRARKRYDNSAGADSAIIAAVDSGVFRYNNSSAGDAIAQADVGNDCYVVDDQTVAKTDGTGTRSVAGKVVAVDSQGVWVFFQKALT
jgi:hypothetical protein